MLASSFWNPASILAGCGDGAAVPAAGILPPAMPGFSAARPAPLFDPAAARSLLARSKYGASLPTLRLALVQGRIVVENDTIPGLDLAQLRAEAQAFVKTMLA
jgi:ABC-type transport system substrate-binding protein